MSCIFVSKLYLRRDLILYRRVHVFDGEQDAKFLRDRSVDQPFGENFHLEKETSAARLMDWGVCCGPRFHNGIESPLSIWWAEW